MGKLEMIKTAGVYNMPFVKIVIFAISSNRPTKVVFEMIFPLINKR